MRSADVSYVYSLRAYPKLQTSVGEPSLVPLHAPTEQTARGWREKASAMIAETVSMVGSAVLSFSSDITRKLTQNQPKRVMLRL